MSESYVKRVKKQMKALYESIDPRERLQRYGVIEDAITKLMATNPSSISEKAVDTHDTETEELEKQMFELQKKMDERYQKTYDKILEEL